MDTQLTVQIDMNGRNLVRGYCNRAPFRYIAHREIQGDYDLSMKGVIMAHPVINTDECIGCGICVDACPQEVLEVSGGVAEVANEDACIACGECVEECPMGAIPEVAED